MEENQIKHKIPHIIQQINKTYDPQVLTHYENLLICRYASILMYLSAFINFGVRLYMKSDNQLGNLLDSAIFLGFAIFYTIIPRLKISTNYASHLISFLYSLCLVFISLNLYPYIGPAIWTIAFIQIVLAMIRITKTMLVYIIIASFISGFYLVVISAAANVQLGSTYYFVQTFLIGLLFLTAGHVHRINISRFETIREQFKTVSNQNLDLEALYEEVAASDEELRQQNEQLLQYNEEIRQNEEHLNHLAYYDTLTELPNRKMVLEELNFYIQISQKHGLTFYVVFIDIDHFKKINDTKGHYCGDMFIKAVANRLKSFIHPDDLLGRIGGDEFALIFQRDLKEEAAFQYVESIRKCFREPFQIDGTQIRSSASFGISVFPQDGDEVIELLKSADTSMYKAKEMGKNNVQFFRKGMKDEIIKKIELENRLLSALQNDEFFLVFQPQYNATTHKIRGFEALIRWQTADLGVIHPKDFIPLTEEMGLIIPLGEWVLRKACQKFKEILDQYDYEICVCVNISVVQMKDSYFIDIIKNVLKETGLDPHRLELEITESVFIESFLYTSKLLDEIKSMGIKIALDDFGTGYSSLSYLKLLPIDILKIDQTFVKDVSLKSDQKMIIGDIISLAHNLDISVIAEGVEHDHQLDYLKTNGCDCVQGFLLGRPLDDKALNELLSSSNDMLEKNQSTKGEIDSKNFTQ